MSANFWTVYAAAPPKSAYTTSLNTIHRDVPRPGTDSLQTAEAFHRDDFYYPSPLQQPQATDAHDPRNRGEPDSIHIIIERINLRGEQSLQL
jgi:hypothetical protein